jgi:hypothetical protein
MKSIWIIFAGLLVVTGIGLAPVLSQDMGEEEGEGEDTSAEDMEAWRKLQQPGDAHKLLGKLTGDWDMHFKMWMAPGTDPTEIKMTTSLAPRYGGRFIVGAYEMTEGPFPHKGETWFGHDNARGKYQWIRVTDMDTTMRLYEGDYDAEAKAITLHASYSMEWQGQVFEVTERNVWKFVNDDKFTMEVFTKYEGMPDMPEDGIREVEITYTRAKPTPPATKDPHGVLKLLEGDFDVDFKIWFDPEGEPIAMSAPMSYHWTLDGQMIVSEYDASDLEMMPHKGIEYISYNEGTGEYDSIRMTSTTGAMIVWRGTYDTDKKTLEFKAAFSGEMNGEKYSGTSRALYKWVNDDKYTAVVYSKYEGMEEEVKEVELVFTRRK